MSQHGKRFLSLIVIGWLIGIAGCGGGGGGEPPPPPSYTLNTMAVKGPLAAATVNVYRFTATDPFLRGEQVASGQSDDQGKVTGITLTGPLSARYIIEFVSTPGTLDLATGKAPVIERLLTLASGPAIQNGSAFYASPLTTLILRTVGSRILPTDDEAAVVQLLQNTTTSVIEQLGFGLPAVADPFSVPSLVTDKTTDLALSLSFRTANEALVATLADAATRCDTMIEAVVVSLVTDIGDGIFNGKTPTDIPLGVNDDCPNIHDLLASAPTQHLPIPGTDKDGDPATQDPWLVSETAQLMLAERSSTGYAGLGEGITDANIRFVPEPIGEDLDDDGYPNLSDADDDGDSVADNQDAFPLDGNETVDSDRDGIGNNGDDDDDGDSVKDSDDDFPLDSAESADSDGDSVGDNADAFPLNPLCDQPGSGEAGQCYVELLAAEPIAAVLQDDQGHAYLVSRERNALFRFTPDGEVLTRFASLSADHGELLSWRFHSQHNRLYFGYEDGTLSFISLDDDATEQALAQLDAAVSGLVDAGNFVVAISGSSTWVEHVAVNASGDQLASQQGIYIGNGYTWDANQNSYYFRSVGISPADIYSISVDQATGQLSQVRETPYHGDYDIANAIVVSPDGTQLINGSGDIYGTQQLRRTGHIPYLFDRAQWLTDDTLLVLQSAEDSIQYHRLDPTRDAQVDSATITGQLLGLVSGENVVNLVINTGDRIRWRALALSADSDGDGIDNINDAFANDPAASSDSDGDGYPEAWNNGRDASDSTTGLVLDAFPDEVGCFLAEHGVNNVCNPALAMPSLNEHLAMAAGDGIVYFAVNDNGLIYRWDRNEQRYLAPLKSPIQAWGTTTMTALAYSEATHQLYVGYGSGELQVLDAQGDATFSSLAKLNGSVLKLEAGAGGVVVTVREQTYHTPTYLVTNTGTVESFANNLLAFDAVTNRVFSGYSSNLNIATIDPGSWQAINDLGVSLNYDLFGWWNHLYISDDGQQLITDQGRSVDTAEFAQYHQFDMTVVDVASASGQQALLGWRNGVPTILFTSGDMATPRGQLALSGTPLFARGDMSGVVIATLVDGQPQFAELSLADQDSDGLPQWWEQGVGLSDSNMADAGGDIDGDGLLNMDEFIHQTDANNPDSDSDGVQDGAEVNTYGSNPLSDDSDSDGLLDGYEVDAGTSLTHGDSDDDGLSDINELFYSHTNPLSADSDADGMGDQFEVVNGLAPTENDAAGDLDTDGLVNLDEFTASTDPENDDSDGDGLLDGDEVHSWSTSPLLADSDSDLLLDRVEVAIGLNPNMAADAEADNDADGYSNREEYFAFTDINEAMAMPQPIIWGNQRGGADRAAYQPITVDANTLTQLWQVEAASTSSNFRAAVEIANGGLVVATHQYSEGIVLNAYNSSGTLLWQRTIADAESYFGQMVSSGSRMVVVTHEPQVTTKVIDATTGQDLYTLDLSTNGYDPVFAVHCDQLISGTNGYSSNGVRAISLTDGSLVWERTDAISQSSPLVNAEGVLSSVSDRIERLSLIDGTTVSATEGWLDFGYERLLSREALYEHQPRAWRDLVTGRRHEASPTTDINHMAFAAGVLYATDYDTLSAYSGSSGELLWQRAIANTPTSLALTRNLAFVTTYYSTMAIDLTSQEVVWSMDVPTTVIPTQFGIVYFIADDGRIWAYADGGDGDSDEMPDWWELSYGLDKNSADDAALDADSDGLSNLAEYQNGGNPSLADSDSDGLADGAEVNTYGTRVDVSDSDSDGLTDGAEVNTHGTNPLQGDTDGDLFSDGVEVNRYGTDPLDAGSKPSVITSLAIDFEDGQLPVGWATNGDGSWLVDGYRAITGSYSAQSPALSDSQSATLVLEELFVPGVLTFDAQVSGESCCDKLQVKLDGDSVALIAHADTPTRVEVTIAESGSHRIEWSYIKDGSVSAGDDRAWIDNITFTAD